MENIVIESFINSKKYSAITEYVEILHPDRDRKVVACEYSGSELRIVPLKKTIHILCPKKMTVVQESNLANMLRKGTVFDDAENVENAATMVTIKTLPHGGMANAGIPSKRIEIGTRGVVGRVHDDGTVGDETDMVAGNDFIKDTVNEVRGMGDAPQADIRIKVNNQLDKFMGIEDDHFELPQEMIKDMTDMDLDMKGVGELEPDSMIDSSHWSDYDADPVDVSGMEFEGLQDDSGEPEISEDGTPDGPNVDGEDTTETGEEEEDFMGIAASVKPGEVEMPKETENDPAVGLDAEDDIMGMDMSLDGEFPEPGDDDAPPTETPLTDKGVPEEGLPEDTADTPISTDPETVEEGMTPGAPVLTVRGEGGVGSGTYAYESYNTSTYMPPPKGSNRSGKSVEPVTEENTVLQPSNPIAPDPNKDGLHDPSDKPDLPFSPIQEHTINPYVAKGHKHLTVQEQTTHHIQEGLLSRKPKRLKPLGRDIIAYCISEKNDIRDANDQAMLSGYICSKLELVDFYLTVLDTQDARYIVPHNRPHLVSMQTQLNNILGEVLRCRPINRQDRVWRIDVNCPDGWRG